MVLQGVGNIEEAWGCSRVFAGALGYNQALRGQRGVKSDSIAVEGHRIKSQSSQWKFCSMCLGRKGGGRHLLAENT